MRPLRLKEQFKGKKSISQVKSSLKKLSMSDVINAKQQAQDVSDELESALLNKGKKDSGKVKTKTLKRIAKGNETPKRKPSKQSLKAPPAAEAPYKPKMTQLETEKEMKHAGKMMELIHHASKMNHPKIRELAKEMKKILHPYIEDHIDKLT